MERASLREPCDRCSISDLLARYCWMVDHGRWSEFGVCFTEDGEFHVRGEHLQGRASIIAYVRSSIGSYRLIRHLAHQPEVRVDGSSAAVRSYFELRGTTGWGTDFEALGVYEDTAVRQGDAWLLASRHVTFDYWVRRGEAFLTDAGS